MTRRDQKALREYVRWVADRVGLRDWHFTLFYEHDEEDAIAICTPTYGRRRAKIQFAADFRTLDVDEQRNSVIHELLHCHLAAVQDQVRLDLPKELAQSAYNLFFAAFRQNLEYAVDAISASLAKDIPHIAWPK